MYSIYIDRNQNSFADDASPVRYLLSCKMFTIVRLSHFVLKAEGPQPRPQGRRPPPDLDSGATLRVLVSDRFVTMHRPSSVRETAEIFK